MRPFLRKCSGAAASIRIARSTARMVECLCPGAELSMCTVGQSVYREEDMSLIGSLAERKPRRLLDRVRDKLRTLH